MLPPWRPLGTRGAVPDVMYYVTREAIADGYNTCPVTSVPAAYVEGAVLDHVQKLLAAPQLVARTWAAAKREGEDEIKRAGGHSSARQLRHGLERAVPRRQARIVRYSNRAWAQPSAGSGCSSR